MTPSIIDTPDAPAAIGPYSQAVWAGNLLFTSGQIPIDPKTGNVVEGGVEAQATQALNNLQAVLKAAGLGLGQVVKTTVFIKDMSDFQKINAVYAGFFAAPCPARSCVEVARLPKDVLIEIEAVASK